MKSPRALIVLTGGISLGAALFGESTDYNVITDAQATKWGERAKSSKPPEGHFSKEAVPAQETAIALAVAVWTPIYGKEEISREAPYQAIRVDDCWFVTESLQKGAIGGTAIAVIKASDGRFLLITHEQ